MEGRSGEGDHPVAEGDDLRLVAGQEHRHAQGPYPLQDAGRPGGVHAGEGLVQQVEPAAAGQGAGQGQPPPHAAGEGRGAGVLLPLQLDQGQPAPRLPPARPGEHIGDVLHPVIPACQDWSTLETLGKEREMIGLYLSAHPLDDYAVIIRNMCKTQLSDLDNLESLRGQEIAVAGMVIATQNLVTKTGKPWGKFTLEDYNGTHEFALFSKDYENFRKYLFNDYFLFIRGKVQPKPYNDKELEFKITSMVQLSEMRDTMIKEMYIQLAIEDITREMIEELTHRIKESEGSTTLRVNVYDRDAQVSVNMFSKRHKVSLTSNLVSFLEDNEIKYTIV